MSGLLGAKFCPCQVPVSGLYHGKRIVLMVPCGCPEHHLGKCEPRPWLTETFREPAPEKGAQS